MASDLISREAAIQSISDWIKDCDNESVNDAVTVIKTLIELLPAVDAIPVEWLQRQGQRGSIIQLSATMLIEKWQKEQEVKDVK